MTGTTCCSLEPEAFEERVAAWRSLAGALLDRQPTATGVRLRYRLGGGVAESLLELVEAERQCCPSLSFTATVTLDVDGPDTARQWVVDTFLGEEGPPVPDPGQVVEAVRRHYAAAAELSSSCCGGGPEGCGPPMGPVGGSLYDAAELEGVPEGTHEASMGCANPVAAADLGPGETVLDLGSGAGLDVLLSARRVGPTGRAYGLEMTDEMLELARASQARAGAENVEFLEGHIEAIPLPDASVDVVVSNCVISLSVDKAAVFAEAYRVLRPGGRMAIADVVADHEPTPEQQADVGAWVACLAGALTRERYQLAVEATGFSAVSLRDSHPVADGFTSVIVAAVKPGLS